MTSWGSWDRHEDEEIRKNNKEWRAWESKDKNRTKMNNPNIKVGTLITPIADH